MSQLNFHSQNTNDKNELLSPPPQTFACFAKAEGCISFLVPTLFNYTKDAQIFFRGKN